MVLEDKMNSVRYTKVLWESLLPFMEEHHPSRAKFQQGNSLVHTDPHTKYWFLDDAVSVLLWPARSSDLNSIEKL